MSTSLNNFSGTCIDLGLVASFGHPLSFYGWLPISKADTAQELEANLIKSGIRVFHSDRFLSGSSMPSSFLRIALSSTKSMEELKIGLEILKAQLN